MCKPLSIVYRGVGACLLAVCLGQAAADPPPSLADSRVHLQAAVDEFQQADRAWLELRSLAGSLRARERSARALADSSSARPLERQRAEKAAGSLLLRSRQAAEQIDSALVNRATARTRMEQSATAYLQALREELQRRDQQLAADQPVVSAPGPAAYPYLQAVRVHVDGQDYYRARWDDRRAGLLHQVEWLAGRLRGIRMVLDESRDTLLEIAAGLPQKAKARDEALLALAKTVDALPWSVAVADAADRAVELALDAPGQSWSALYRAMRRAGSGSGADTALLDLPMMLRERPGEGVDRTPPVGAVFLAVGSGLISDAGRRRLEAALRPLLDERRSGLEREAVSSLLGEVPSPEDDAYARALERMRAGPGDREWWQSRSWPGRDEGALAVGPGFLDYLSAQARYQFATRSVLLLAFRHELLREIAALLVKALEAGRRELDAADDGRNLVRERDDALDVDAAELLLSFSEPMSMVEVSVNGQAIDGELQGQEWRGGLSVGAARRLQLEVTGRSVRDGLALDALPATRPVLSEGVWTGVETGPDREHRLRVEAPHTVDAPHSPPKDVVLVFGASASMAGGRLDAARQAVRTLLQSDGFPPQTRFALVVFQGCGEVKVDVRFTTDRERLLSVLDGLEARGGSPLAKAVERACRYAAREAGEQRALVLFTDGEESCDGNPMTAFELCRRLGMGAKDRMEARP